MTPILRQPKGAARGRKAGTFYRALVAVSYAIVVVAHLPSFVFAKFANVDEAYALALAERMLEGQRLYDGAVSQRGPLMYYLFELFASIHGWDNVRGIRVVALLFALAHLWLVWTLGRSLIGEGVAAIATLITAYTITLGLFPWDGIALNGESLQVPFILGGALVGGLAARDPEPSSGRRFRFGIAGFLFGCAFCIKQSAALIPLAPLVWLAVTSLRRRTLGSAVIDAVVYGAGALLPVAFFVAHAAAIGTLDKLLYYCVRYNLEVHRTAGRRFADWFQPVYQNLREHTAFFVLIAVAVTFAAIRWTGRARRAVRTRSPRALLSGFSGEDYVALAAFGALAMAASLPQHFGHYYIVPTPFLALAAASVVRRAARPFRIDAGLGVALAACAGLLVVYTALFAYQTADDKGLLTHDRNVMATAEYIERTTSPDDKIFVWGFSPWLYEYAHRRPAGRYVFETYVTGFVPLFWGDLEREPARVVPGSMQALLGDLDRERPAVVADAGSLLMARPMRAYPAPAAWLHESYCFEARVGAVDIYRRRDGRTCATPYFPCPHPPLGHFGQPMWVPTPPVVDLESSRLLGPGPSDQPKGFAPGETLWPCTAP